MLCRLLIAFLILSLPLTILADGCAYSNRFLPQLQETNQLAVINLTETTADVSMFISIEGIPAGEQITYILPFWYQPDGFTLVEDDSDAFHRDCVDSAKTKLDHIRNMAKHRATSELVTDAPIFGNGFLAMLFIPRLMSAGDSARSAAYSAQLTPYTTSATAHASAALFRINQGELQQLLRQSGLPDRYLQPLQKYRTPFFAVMQLQGLTSAEKEQATFNGKGVRYHFTHRITDGDYTYPLGTGASWPQPIPITEVYLTCTDSFGLKVQAPIEGEKRDWREFRARANDLTDYLSHNSAQQSNSEQQQGDGMLQPQTGSLLAEGCKLPFAWHIAYLQSNPSDDIHVHLTKRFAPWRLAVVDYFSQSGVPFLYCIVLYLLAWVATGWFVIRRRWLRAGSPGYLSWHTLTTFIKVELVVVVIPVAVIMLFSSLLGPIVVGLFAFFIFVFRKPAQDMATDWKKGLSLTSWASSLLFFAGLVAMLYGFLYWCESM